MKTTEFFLYGIISLALGCYSYSGRHKRADKETTQYDSTARWHNHIEAYGLMAFLFGLFFMMGFLYRIVT